MIVDVDPVTAIKSSHQVEKLSGSDSGSNGIGSGREVKKYIRWEESWNLLDIFLISSLEQSWNLFRVFGSS